MSGDRPAPDLERQVVIDNEYVTLWYRPDGRIVHHRLHRFVVRRAFEEFLLAGVDLLLRHRAACWLSDDRANPVLAPDLQAWAREQWFPLARAAGWRHWAMLPPSSELGRWTTQRAVDEYAAAGIEFRAFADEAAALDWLRDRR